MNMKLWNYKMRFVLALQSQLVVNATNALAMINQNKELGSSSISRNQSYAIIWSCFTICFLIGCLTSSFHSIAARLTHAKMRAKEKARWNKWQEEIQNDIYMYLLLLLSVCVCARFSSWLWCKMRKCMQRHFAMRFIKFHAKTAHNLHNHAQFACNPVCLFVWLRLYYSIRSHSRSTLDRMQVVLVCMQIHTNTLAHIMLSEENLSEEHASASKSSIAIANCYYFKNTKFSLQIQLKSGNEFPSDILN